MKKKVVLAVVTMIIISFTYLGASATAKKQAAPLQAKTQMANPASVNCIQKGGKLVIKKLIVDGRNLGEYGVCVFEENRQCEEWAMFRGECPTGGVKLTGYVTEAARNCAIKGGKYKVTGKSNTPKEQGSCTLPDGTVCDAWEYYKMNCPKN